VIIVPVTDKNEICLHVIRGNGSGGISIQERIDNDFLSIRLESKSRVPVPGEFRGHKYLLLVLLCIFSLAKVGLCDFSLISNLRKAFVCSIGEIKVESILS
jgi:hypothetical protein